MCWEDESDFRVKERCKDLTVESHPPKNERVGHPPTRPNEWALGWGTRTLLDLGVIQTKRLELRLSNAVEVCFVTNLDWLEIF